MTTSGTASSTAPASGLGQRTVSATSAPRCYAVVPCAGTGQRAGTAGPKQYEALADRAVVAHTLAALAAVPRLVATLVVLAPDDTAFERHAPEHTGPRAWTVRSGGATRAASVAAGLPALLAHGARPTDWVLVHDAARCLLQPAWVDRLIDSCADDAVGGLLALPMADTLKVADGANNTNTAPRTSATVSRSGKWLAQTPQMFRIGVLQQALASAAQSGIEVTDEASAIEALGLAPRLVVGDYENFKLTWPGDFTLAARLLATRLPATRFQTATSANPSEGHA
jgi:2-C-methyl-D-erythritol 4-phosphate cytidylyltransferase